MIYLDYHATSPCSKSVIEHMNAFHTQSFANIGSAHAYGQKVRDAFQQIESRTLEKTHLPKFRLLYTSGATESINIAHLGLLEHCKTYNKQILTTKIEHKATLNVLNFMQKQGVQVNYLDVDSNGRVDLDQLRNSLQQQDTAVFSFIQGNNEIGVLQDEQACINLAKHYGAWVHMDISQSLCIQPSFQNYQEVDMLSFSGHKIYGPKGVGGLILNETGSKRIPLKPLMYGGGGEENSSLKPGTHPTALAVGLCVALEETFDHAPARQKHFLQLKHNFIDKLKTVLDGWCMTGNIEFNLPQNIHLNFDKLSQNLVPHLHKIAVSSGSTCSAKSQLPSHVLKAIGMSDDRALSSLRIGLGVHNTQDHMDIAANDIAYTVKKMREKTSI